MLGATRLGGGRWCRSKTGHFSKRDLFSLLEDYIGCPVMTKQVPLLVIGDIYTQRESIGNGFFRWSGWCEAGQCLIDSIEYVTVRASNGRGDIVVAEAS